MDKYEFNIKVEQIKKLISEGDYATAMKIADSIDWSRVRNANLLSMVAGVYEKNNEYQEAKDILLSAFERAPVGKRLLYKLTELSVKSGDIEEAEDYYHEFADLAPDDMRQYLLKYLILKAKGATADQLLDSLERYTEGELDEKWLYELAELYDRAGKGAECVRTCDKITLLFGLGNYSDRAMDLKMKYAPLNQYQMDLMRNMGRPEYNDSNAYDEYYGESGYSEDYPDNSYSEEYADDYNDEYTGNYESGYGNDSGDGYRDKYYTEPEEEPADDLSQRYEDEDRAAEEYLRQHEELLRRMPKKPVSYEENEIEGFEEKLGNEVKKISKEMPETGSLDDIKIDGGKTKILDEAVKEKLRKVVIIDGETQGDETSSASACEIQEQSTHEEPYQETESEDSGAYNDSYNEEKSDDSEENEATEEISTGTDTDASLPQKQDSEPAKEEPADYASESKKMSEYGDIEHYHMMIEAETPEDGLKTAIEELKYIHNEKGIKNSAARTNAAKLNERGLSQAAVERLRGKDLIIEDAGDLSDELLDDIYDLIKNDDSGMIVVLTDTPDRLDDIIERHPALADEFDIVSEDYDEEYTDEYEEPAEEEEDYSDYSEDEDEPEAESYPEEVVDDPYDEYADEPYDEDAEYEEDNEEEYEKPQNSGRPSGSSYDEEMDIDEFAKYCCQYASEIDCSITGKSMLALYERIELMEEDSIPLTKENAEALIEEAADKAEKPPIGKRIKGMFNSKYDKNGLLILKEEDFIN